MNKVKEVEKVGAEETYCGERVEAGEKGRNKEWEKPTLEDVSEKVMAQPYIRFT